MHFYYTQIRSCDGLDEHLNRGNKCVCLYHLARYGAHIYHEIYSGVYLKQHVLIFITLCQWGEAK